MRKPKITYDTTPRYTDWTVRDIPADECFDLIDRRGRALATLAYGSCSSARPDDLYNRAVVLERVELICQAVNAHAPLVEALERYGRHDYACPAIRFDGITPVDDPDCDCGLRAALTLARGGQP